MSITQEDVTAYVHQWRDRLHLQGWTLLLDFKRLEGGRAGQCATVPSYWHAHIDFDLERLNEAPGHWKQLVIHELLHVVCARVHAHSEAIYRDMGDPGESGALAAIGNMEAEAVIERLAGVLHALEHEGTRAIEGAE